MSPASANRSADSISTDMLARRTGGQWHANDAASAAVKSIEIDSRKCSDGALFVALPGVQADGHDFIAAAAKRGATAALVATPDTSCAMPQLVVGDVHTALNDLGIAGRTAHRAAGGKLAGITGSVGKTGSKEMLAHLLCRLAGPAGFVSSRASFNNHLGVPLTLSMLPGTVAPAIQEMGMNAAGEISRLSRMASPDVAVITCVADSHAGFFESLADIATAKAEIFDGMDKDGIAVLNRDDAFFKDLAARAKAAGISDIMTFGRHEDAYFRLLDIKKAAAGQIVDASLSGTAVRFTLGMRNAHWADNAMAVLAAVHTLGFDPVDAARYLDDFNDLPGRGAVLSGAFHSRRITLIDDSYNAGPRSMQAALAGLHGTAPQILVLSDMLELGDWAAAAHTALAPPIIALRPRVIITIGAEMSRMATNLPCLGGEHIAAATPDDAIASLRKSVCNGDTVFIKGSLGSGAWRVARAVLDAFSQADPKISGGANNAA